MGSTTVEAPKPSKIELEMQKEQLELMRKSVEREEALEPFVLKTLGLVKNPDGTYRNMTEEEYYASLTPMERSYYDLQQQQIALQQEQLALQQQLLSQEHEVQREQLALQKKQLRMAEEAFEEQKAIAPLIYESFGIVKTPEGKYRRMTEEERLATFTEPERMAYETAKLMLERQQKALRGELPVSESLRQAKAREWKLFKEAMARAGNPIIGDTPEEATSPTTAGIQGIRQFLERFSILEEAERKGELSTETSAALQMLGITSDIGRRASQDLYQNLYRDLYQLAYAPATRTTGLTTGLGGLPTVAEQLTNLRQGLYGYIAAPTQLAGLYSGLLEPYQRQREMQFAVDYANAMSRSGLWGSFLGMLGTLGGALLQNPKIISSKKFKQDIKKTTAKEEKQALETLKKMKTYTYHYKWEDDREPKRYGLLAENAPPEIVTPDKQGIDVGRLMGLLTSASRAIARQVERRN